MSGWKKVKSLFWQSEAGGGEAPSDEDLSDEDFAAMLGGSEHAVAPGAAQAVDPSTVNLHASGAASVEIDFQAQYDAAEIPNTDEVEQLERFLGGLDPKLPQDSKLAAARAFLGAVGKSTNDVLGDAARKIERVRGILSGVESSTRHALAQEAERIQTLEREIDAHKKQMEQMNSELEGVRKACLVEESRLQAARVFFGSVTQAGGA